MARPRPLAVGLLGHLRSSAERERRRVCVQLSLTAETEGFALVEAYDTGRNGLQEDVAFAAADGMAACLNVRAVVCAGELNEGRLRDLAARRHLRVIQV